MRVISEKHAAPKSLFDLNKTRTKTKICKMKGFA